MHLNFYTVPEPHKNAALRNNALLVITHIKAAAVKQIASAPADPGLMRHS
jgi:hypothetical protein